MTTEKKDDYFFVHAEVKADDLNYSLSNLTEDERVKIFSAVSKGYCFDCGQAFSVSIPICHCKNDE